MASTSSRLTRRSIIAAVAVVAVAQLPISIPAAAGDSIRSFRINIPQEALVDLRQRIAATRWPDKETVADQSQGVPLATMQQLAQYWQTDYDWRKVEAHLNTLPQFITEIDGLVFISFTFVQSMRRRCRSSSRMGGRARSSSS